MKIDLSLLNGNRAFIWAVNVFNFSNCRKWDGGAKLGVSHRDWHIYAKNQIRGTQKETALQIHRFYIAMQYGEGVYGIEMTVREKRNGATVFYTLEAHDLDIQKINPETESPRGGVVKAALPGRSPAIE